MINLTNYEIYFLDYAEGCLDKDTVGELMDFIGQHPQLKEELEAFSILSIPSDNSVELPFSALLKDNEDAFSLSAITSSNCDYWFAAYYEGDLNSKQEVVMNDFLKKNPHQKVSFNAFEKTKLETLTTIYPNKRALKHFDLTILRKPLIWSAAAVLAGFILISGYTGIDHNPITEPFKNISIIKNTPMDATKSTEAIKIDRTMPIAVSVLKYYKPTNQPNAIAITLQERAELINKLPAIEITEISTKNNHPLLRKSYDYVQVYQDVLLRDQLQEFARIEEMSLAGRVIYKTKQFLGQEIGSIPHITFYDMARYGVEGFNEITGNDIALKRSKDSNGKLLAFAFGNENFRVASSKKDKTE
ncbi:MAG: hypothetical protein Q7J34_02640 [Bacteroidales bacterium]|nr:hypothetical protein [Bacteroidales bacterium]